MALYLTSLKLDHETGDELEITLNAVDAKKEGINAGDIVSFSYADVLLYAEVEITDTAIPAGYVGLNEEVWVKYNIPSEHSVVVSIIDRPKSIDAIKNKLLGHRFTEEELKIVTKDISERKIREVEIAYFMSTFFNPGFNDDEVLWTIKGMAEAGDILDFTDINGNGTVVVDKHSIGGVAAKGVTPILVPIIAAHGLVIPNTSTRAITTPAGTSDILEVIMPIKLENQEVLDTVAKTNAVMMWGGALKLSPADDVLINVEKGLHIQSFQKMLVSIVAKKVSMGISHILIDIPYGPGTKVESPEDVEVLTEGFINTFDKVDIKCEVFSRHVTAPDGNGVGPALEIRDILRVYEQHPERPKGLEDTATAMAGQLLELAGRAAVGKGQAAALDKLKSGEALEKLWEIAFAQGAKERMTSEDISVGEYTHEYKAEESGTIDIINNKQVVRVARALGNPQIKEAGLYFEKTAGEKIEKGDTVLTLYASSPERLEAGKAAFEYDEMFKLR